MHRVLLFIYFILLTQYFAQNDKYEYKETQELVNFVDSAVSVIEKSGEEAFGLFAKDSLYWNNPEQYLFVLDMEGNNYYHIDKKLIGQNQIDIKDVNGKPFIRWFIYQLTGNRKNAWTHYQWVKPGQIFPTWKSTYIRMAVTSQGHKYIVGSGRYNLKTEKSFVVEMVLTAEEFIKRHGKDFFEVLKDKRSEFCFKDNYLFIIDEIGTLLANPAFPSLENSNLYNYTDTEGKFLVREILDLANRKGEGWIDYMWPKPGDNNSSKKMTYIKKINTWQGVFIIGMGIYE